MTRRWALVATLTLNLAVEMDRMATAVPPALAVAGEGPPTKLNSNWATPNQIL